MIVRCQHHKTKCVCLPMFCVVRPKFYEGCILNSFGSRFLVPVVGFGDQVNQKCVLKVCVCAIFL